MNRFKYHKIQTVFKRDPATNHKNLLVGDYSRRCFEFLSQNTWVFTEKVDGTNIRVMLIDGELVFGGRTERSQTPATLLNRLNEIFLPLKTKMTEMFPGKDVCLYGEGYGAGIQKGGGNYGSTQEFVMFDIRVEDIYLCRNDVEGIAEALDLRAVPVIGFGTLNDLVNMVSWGFKSTWGDFEAEGVVARPLCELLDKAGRRIITKLKLRDFQ